MGSDMPKLYQAFVREFRETLQRLRSHGVTRIQQEIADEIGIHQSTFSNFYNYRFVEATTLAKIERYHEKLKMELAKLSGTEWQEPTAIERLPDDEGEHSPLIHCLSCGERVIAARYCSECGDLLVPAGLEAIVTRIVRAELAHHKCC